MPKSSKNQNEIKPLELKNIVLKMKRKKKKKVTGWA